MRYEECSDGTLTCILSFLLIINVAPKEKIKMINEKIKIHSLKGFLQRVDIIVFIKITTVAIPNNA